MIFWRKIVIFHTKYPKQFRASHRSAQLEILDPPLEYTNNQQQLQHLITNYIQCFNKRTRSHMYENKLAINRLPIMNGRKTETYIFSRKYVNLRLTV